MLNGTATPNDVNHMETRIKERSDGLLSELKVVAKRIFSRRDEPQTIMGMVGMFWRLMEVGKEQGVPEGSFHPESLVIMNGGLKGLRLPNDYQEQLGRFFGKVSSPKMYGMTELSSQMVMCGERMYHAPVELLPLILDETGEHLLSPGADGKVTGRFAAFNLLVEGHWGGVISGDLVTANYSPLCECGLPGPVIEEHVARYSELSRGRRQAHVRRHHGAIYSRLHRARTVVIATSNGPGYGRQNMRHLRHATILSHLRKTLVTSDMRMTFNYLIDGSRARLAADTSAHLCGVAASAQTRI